MKKDARIFVAGHAGLIGSAMIRRLEREGYTHICEMPKTLQQTTNEYRQPYD